MSTALMALLSVALFCIGAVQAQTSEPITPTPSKAIEQVVWRGSPIRLDLRLGSERTVRLPGSTRLRSGLLGGPVPGLRIQSLGDHLYLLAEQPFANTRLLVQSDGGASILLDLAADKTFPAGASLEILTPPVSPTTLSTATTEATPVTPEVSESPVGYVALIRHAAQSLYAPIRLIPRSDRIVRTPIPTDTSLHLVRGAHIKATPVAAWRAPGPHGPLWVAAVKLRNALDRPAVLDPRDLRGQWRAASFQHARLGSAGEPTDTTTVYLISDRRFTDALGAFATP